MELIALLPWWAAVGLGVVSYFALHAFAAPPQVTGFQPGQMGAVLSRSMMSALAGAGQYLLPVLCFGAAIVSFIGRRQRAQLVANVKAESSVDILEGISWQQFELLVGEAFRLQGYRVAETGASGPDGGVDLILHKDREKFFVQCKQWKAFKVSVQVVRELYGVMAAHGAAGGFVVTSGRFTEDASSFASGRNVTLIDGPKLVRMIQQAKAALASGSTRDAQRDVVGRPASSTQSVARTPTQAPPSTSAEPTCPVCARPMVLRTARRGANAGGSFWGCTGYPDCRATKPVA